MKKLLLGLTVGLLSLGLNINSCYADDDSTTPPEPTPVVTPPEVTPPEATPPAPADGTRVVKDTMTESDFSKLFAKEAIGLAPDEFYWAPSREWVEDALLPEYRQFLQNSGIQYSSHFDCDDFARVFAAWASLYWDGHRTNNPQESLACAEFWYVMAPRVVNFHGIDIPLSGGGHAINVIVLNDGTLFFIEPQAGIEMPVSADEQATCMMVKF